MDKYTQNLVNTRTLNNALYVSNTGSDHDDPNDINSPYLTLEWALSKITNLQDTAYLREGTYYVNQANNQVNSTVIHNRRMSFLPINLITTKL